MENSFHPKNGSDSGRLTRRDTLRLAGMFALAAPLVACGGLTALAQQPVTPEKPQDAAPKNTAPTYDVKRLDLLREAIFSSQLSDGAIAAVGYRTPGRPVLLEPYFNGLSCLGLLAAHAAKPDPRTFPSVEKYLEWGAIHQAKDGTMPRFEGILSAERTLAPGYKQLPEDAQDSAAAIYLAVAGAYVQQSKLKLSPVVVAACRKCLEVLASCKDPNGFYWNFNTPNTPTGGPIAQYALDNVEVAQAFSLGSAVFRAAGDEATAKAVETQAKDLASRMHQFWYPEKQYFVCMIGEKLYQVDWKVQPVYAAGLAVVSALAFFDNVSEKTRRAQWMRLIQHGTDGYGAELEVGFRTKIYANEDPTIERVYFAAQRAAPQAHQDGLYRGIELRADEFIHLSQDLAQRKNEGARFPYVHRYAMLLQALLLRGNAPITYLPNIPLDPKVAP